MRLAAGAALLVSLAGVPCLSAEPDNAGIRIVSTPGAPATLSADALAKLPEVTVAVSFGTAHGQMRGSFHGPLLWTVLQQAGAVAKSPRDQVRQTVAIFGRDGYVAVLAMGEIAPAIEGKSVILAERVDGKTLPQPRLVVPGDRHGARSVRDVTRIAVASEPAAAE